MFFWKIFGLVMNRLLLISCIFLLMWLVSSFQFVQLFLVRLFLIVMIGYCVVQLVRKLMNCLEVRCLFLLIRLYLLFLKNLLEVMFRFSSMFLLVVQLVLLIVLRMVFSVLMLLWKFGVKLFLLFIVVFRLWFFSIDFSEWKILVLVCSVLENEVKFIGSIMNFWKLMLLLVCVLLLMMFIIGIGSDGVMLVLVVRYCYSVCLFDVVVVCVVVIEIFSSVLVFRWFLFLVLLRLIR